MAKSTTLFDKLNAGQTNAPVQQLAANRGLASAPITAYGTSLIGGGEDQAKMAGTPAQKGAAIAAATKVATLGGETEKEREATFAEAKESGEDIAKKELASKYIDSLGTYGAKVTEWIESSKKKMTQQTADVVVDSSDVILSGLDATQKEIAINLIKKIATEPDSQKRLDLELQLNMVLRKDINTVLSATDKANLYNSVADSIRQATIAGEKAIKGADSKLTASDITELGTTLTELSSLLSVPETDLQNMTLGQLQDKIEQVTQQQLGTTATIQSALGGAFSPAEKAALTKYLRDVQATGVTGAEAGVANIVDQVDKQNSVTFAGKNYTIDELLGSSAMTEVFQSAITELESTSKTGPTLEALKKDEPALYNWFIQNYDGVKKLIETSTKTSTEFGDIQKENVAALGEIGASQPELAKSFGYDPSQLRSTKIDPKQLPPAFQFVNNAPPDQRKTLAANLRTLSDAAGVDMIKGLDDAQLKQLDLTNPSGPWAGYSNAVKDSQRYASLTNIDDVVKELSSGDESIAQLNDELTGDALAIALGIPTSNVKEFFDVTGDGVIDNEDVAGIKEKYKSSVPSIADYLKGSKPQSSSNIFTLSRPQSSDPVLSNAFTALAPLLRDKKIDRNEDGFIVQMASPLDESTLQSLIAKNWDSVPGGASVKAVLQTTLRDKVSKRTQGEEKERGAPLEYVPSGKTMPRSIEKTQGVFKKAAAVADTVSEKGEAVIEPIVGLGKAGKELVTEVGKGIKSAPGKIKKGKIKI